MNAEEIRMEVARLISDTNQPGHWVHANRVEKDRRLKEADAIISFLKEQK
jgi:hypothetical protein